MAKKLSSWNLFVKKVYNDNKKFGKSFKECLKIASSLKKQGKMGISMKKGRSTKKAKR
jgi:hypothetical protein